ncbi:MAG: ATP-binding protein [Planctomycetaceae bacterium]
MLDYEKLGVFYLGRLFDLKAKRPRDELLLYDTKDLTTHAVCVGMTGSGKTGLCLALLEEAAIDGIPAIAIDPKGDVGNLLLTFPELRPADFQPWVDRGEAERQGVSVEQLAGDTADRWRKGLAEWGEAPERIAKFRASADVAIYTPGSSAGLPLGVLRSFTAPSEETLNDADALRERIGAAVSGLLALLRIDADPLRSREHILLANILDHAWRDRRDIDMAGLIREIQKPPFDKIGVMNLDDTFPEKDRYSLSMTLNNLLASPGFSAWMQGEPLDIQRLLYTREGKPRLSILSIAHLSDAERMFFVTLLLNEVVAWMRGQSGTSSLRALLYMDEVFGYFPPSANPPSKVPMLRLLKSARAYGLGIVLATQNPVDLDYKGLANTGTWFVGRLQTERDKARLLDGLEGASAAAGSTFDRPTMDRVISGLGNRVFLMNNVHEDAPVVFQSRWALSYLRGPLTREQIQSLMKARKEGEPTARPEAPQAAAQRGAVPSGARPILPPEIEELFIPDSGTLADGATLVYRPALLGTARIHYSQSSAGVDEWNELTVLAVLRTDTAINAVWNNAEIATDEGPELEKGPAGEARAYERLPGDLARPKTFSGLADQLKDYLYRTQTLTIWKCAAEKQTSRPAETEGEFRARLSHAARERRDADVEKIRARYATKFKSLADRKLRAQQKVEREKSQATQHTLQSVFSFASSLLSAVLGRKLFSSTNIGRATTAARSASRIGKERQDVEQAEESLQVLAEREAELNAELEKEVDALDTATAPDRFALDAVNVKPKKSDLVVSRVALVWAPWHVSAAGIADRAW